MHQNAPLFENALTPRQASALPHLACASTMTEGAKLAQIDRSTLRRWMHDEHFRAELDRMRREAVSLAQAKIEALMLKSVLTIAEALDDPSAVVRLRAARALIHAGFKTQEAHELRRRLDLLDDTITRLRRQR